MKLENLKILKKVTAYFEPFKKNVRCKVEEFIANKCNDKNGEIEPIGFIYKLTGSINGFEIIINISNQEQVDSYKLKQ